MNYLNKGVFIYLLSASAHVAAQPILTYASDAPQPWSQFEVQEGPGFAPGIAGPNAQYDFSNFIATDTVWKGFAMTDSTTTYFGCPLSDPVNMIGYGGCLRLVDSALYYYDCGYFGSVPVVSSFGRRTLLKYPLQYADTWTENWSTQMLIGPGPCVGTTLSWMDTTTVDGYGMIQTATGQFGPVLRVRTYSWLVNPPISSSVESYRFYLPGISYPVAELIYRDSISIARLINPLEVGFLDHELHNSFELSPVPTNGQLNISIQGRKRNFQAFIIGVNGNTIQQFKISETETRINVSHLLPGCYLLSLEDSGGNRSTRRFVTY